MAIYRDIKYGLHMGIFVMAIDREIDGDIVDIDGTKTWFFITENDGLESPLWVGDFFQISCGSWKISWNMEVIFQLTLQLVRPPFDS